MKALKILVLTLILACAAHAGDMPQWDQVAPPAPSPGTSHATTSDISAKILVAVIQSLLSR
jgi:hypothetical protein